jgi:integrase/recombinase XerD
MARLRSRKAKPKKAAPLPHNPLQAMLPPYLEWMQVRLYSENTVETRRNQLGVFLRWCDERGLENPHEITRPVLERYQRYLFHYRQRNGRPLSFRTQHGMLVPLRGWFRWMTRQNHILHNPASQDTGRLLRSDHGEDDSDCYYSSESCALGLATRRHETLHYRPV